METGEHVPRHLHAGRVPVASTRRRWALPLLAVGIALTVAAVGIPRSGDRRSNSATQRQLDTELAADSAALDICIRASVEDRVGLVLVVGLPGVTGADDPLVDRLVDAGVGGVMLRDDNIISQGQVIDLVGGLRRRLGDHLLVAVDDEGGRVSSMRALAEPIRSARRLGQGGTGAAHDAGLALGELAASVGIDWVLAPVADLDDGPSDGIIGDRSFGSDPVAAAATTSAFAAGLHEAGVAVTAKHFPGHGGAGDPHAGRTVDLSTLADLEGTDLVPFRALISSGAEATMVGHVTYPALWGDLPASLAPGAYDLLRAQGFQGVAITDALGMGAVHARYGFDLAPAMALAAGADAVLVTQGDQVLTLRDGLLAAVHAGRLPEARLDGAVRRVLTLRGQDPDGVVCRAPTA